MNGRRLFTILVYPFRYSAGRRRLARDAPRHWKPLHSRFDGPGRRAFLDDTFFFLPHIRDFLFADDARTSSAAQALRETHADVVVRLTLDSVVLSEHNPIQVLAQDASAPLVFRIEWADIFIFPQEVGFISLKIAPEDPDASIETLSDLLRSIRQLFSPTVSLELPRWRTAAGVELEGRELVEFLLQGWTSLAPVEETALAPFVERFRTRPADEQYTLTSEGQSYGDSFRLYTFAGMPHEVWEAGPSAPFASAWDRHLYELTTTTILDEPSFFPHTRAAEKFSQELVAIWDDWHAAVHSDHVVFGARCDAFTPHLAHNVGTDYFHLFMLSMFVKIRLSLFFGDLIQRNPSLLRNLFAARAISRSFVRFQNEFWFPEVTHKPQGTFLYERFQNGQMNPRLYAELNDKVQNLVAHLEQRYQFAVAVLIALLVAPKTFQEIVEGIAWLIARAIP